MFSLSPSQHMCFNRILYLHERLVARKLIIMLSPPGHGKTFLAKKLADAVPGVYIDCASASVLTELAGRAGLYYTDWTDVVSWVDKVDRAHENSLLIFDNFNLLMSISREGDSWPFFANTKNSQRGNTLLFCITEVRGVTDWLKDFWEADKLILVDFGDDDSKHVHHALGKIPGHASSAHEI